MRRASAAAALALLALPASAQDAALGRALYETHCLACHYERIHKRDPSRSPVKSHADLRVEVAKRAALTGRTFSARELDDIAEYLDRTHYKLRK